MSEWLEALVEKASKKAGTNKNMFDGFSPIFVYGTGTFAQDIQRVLTEYGLPLSGFLDHRGTKESINGLHVYRPDNPDIKKAVVIIGIHNREAEITTIINNLRELGYSNILTPVDLYDNFAEKLGKRFWLTSRTYYPPYAFEIQKMYDLLNDDQSRETVLSIIRFRITGDYSFLPKPDIEHQYFPPDLPPYKQPLRFVDCGAYNGDTIQALLDSGYEFEALAAFEPDPDNFHKLSAFIAANAIQLPGTSLFPCGVFSSTKQLNFQTGKGEGSKVSSNGSVIVQCTSLDEAIRTFRPTLIKMDIEGAEIEALRGAEKIIIEDQPALAISIYHTPSHLWEIPLLIHEMHEVKDLRYTYHIRTHAQNSFETIFYAIPQRQPA